LTLARRKKPGEKRKREEVDKMNEMERNKIVEAEEAVQGVYSEGFEGFGNEAGTGGNAQAYGFVRARELLETSSALGWFPSRVRTPTGRRPTSVLRKSTTFFSPTSAFASGRRLWKVPSTP
jgi:hypothetical protein